MNLPAIILVLFIAIKQISANEGKVNGSNRTSTISDALKSTFLFKNVEALFKKIDAIKKENSSTAREENSTTSATEDLSTHNVTQKPFANNSAVELNRTASTVKQEEAHLNTTTNEDYSSLNTTNEESKNISTLNENSTTEDSSIHNSTLENFERTSTIEENPLNITAAQEETDLYTKEREDATNTNSNEEETENNYVLKDDNLTSDKIENITPGFPNDEETETISDIVTMPELPALDPQEHENYCKSFINKLLLATFTEHAKKLDPLVLEDRKISFEARLFISSVKGEVGIYDGKVTGMSNGKPVGRCIVDIKDDRVRLMTVITFDESELSYKGRATFLEFGPKITVNGKLIGIFVELVIDVPKDGGTGEIKSVRVRSIGKLKVNVQGLGPLNWALELISEQIVNDFRLDFRRSVERELGNAMEEEIRKISYP